MKRSVYIGLAALGVAAAIVTTVVYAEGDGAKATEDRTAPEQEQTVGCEYATLCHTAGSECACAGKDCDRCADFVDENSDRVCDKQATCERHGSKRRQHVTRSCGGYAGRNCR